MNIINLNLLPPSKKDRLGQTIRFLFTKHILETVIIVYSILAIASIASWLIIQEQFTYLSTSAVSINREFSAHNQEIRKVNAIIRELSATRQDFAPLAPLLLNLATSTPPSIKFSSISINRGNNTLNLTGMAKDRTALLFFQDSLKNMPWLKMREAPLTPFLQKENINFELSAEITGLPALSTQRQ